jgi:hypothetical protein
MRGFALVTFHEALALLQFAAGFILNTAKLK